MVFEMNTDEATNTKAKPDNPYLPPQVCDSNIDVASANEPGRTPSGFSFKFVVFAVACNLMFGGAAELLGSGSGRAAFGAEFLVFFGSLAVNLALVLVGLFAIGCVKLGKKSLNVARALMYVFLTTLLCYVAAMIVYFCRGGQFLI